MSGFRGRVAFGVLAFCAASSLSAQIELPRVSEVVEVRVTNIDVIVTDNRGNRVHGLTKDDFEVYDGGTRQEITNFSEINVRSSEDAPAEAENASEPPQRHIVIVFDVASTAPYERRRVAADLSVLFDDLRPVDDVTIVSWNRTLNIVVPPTNDRAALERGLDRVARQLSARSAGMTLFGHEEIAPQYGGVPTPMMGSVFAGTIGPAGGGAERAASLIYARRRMRQAVADLTEGARSVNAILTRLAGLDGRKALILVSSGFAFAPGGTASTEQELLLWLENLDAPTLLESVASAANAAGVPIYPIHAKGLQSGVSASDGSAEEMLARMYAMSGSADGLVYLAARTGGLVAQNIAGFRRAVQRISEDLSSYYSIGYRATVLRKDDERPVKVRTRNRSYRVRARGTVVERSFESEVADRVLTALLFPATSNDLGVTAEVVKAERKRRFRYAIPVDVRIPMAALSYRASGEDHLEADISIFIGSADPSGSISDVARFRRLIPVKREQFSSIGDKFYTYELDVDLHSISPDNKLAIAVLDNISKVTSLITVDTKASR